MLIEDGVARMVRSKGYVERGKEDWVAHARLPVTKTANLRFMAETGQPIAIADTHLDPNWVRFPEVEWLRSYAGAPIVSKGQVIGFLNLDSVTPGFFAQEHAQRLQAFANQAGIAIENARLYSSLQEANAQLRVALQAKEEMTQNVSHELRTPLTLIMGYVELDRDGPAWCVERGSESRAAGDAPTRPASPLHGQQFVGSPDLQPRQTAPRTP